MTDLAGGGKVAFCFPGQGALEAGMGRELAEAVPAAMDVLISGSSPSPRSDRSINIPDPASSKIMSPFECARCASSANGGVSVNPVIR